MSTPPNIEHFSRVVLVTFVKLYDAFPVPTELKVAELAEAATPGTIPREANFKNLQPTFEAVRFLAKEGFLQYSDHWQDGTAFLQGQLTLKGFTVLGKVPDALQNKPSLISQAKDALKAGAKSAATDAVKDLVGQIFAAAIAISPTVAAVIK